MGKIELDHTGAGSGITLSSDGADLLLNGTAVGGGGAALELYAENPSSPTAPSATGTNAVAIGSESVSSGPNSIAIGTNANTNHGIALGLNTLSSSLYSTSIGANSAGSGAWAAGFGSVALGGSRASSADSFAAATANNTSSYGATGANSVAIGQEARASNFRAIAIGSQCVASGRAAVALGRTSDALGTESFAIGTNAQAEQENSVAIGEYAKSSVVGKHARSSFGHPWGIGDSQIGELILRLETTDATPAALVSNASAPNTTNQIILPNNSAYAFHGTIVARQQASQGTACAAFKIEGLIRREGNAGTTVLVNSATTVLDNTPGLGMTLSADTVNGGLKIEVTGLAATNIRFVATISTSEVTF